MTDRNAKTTSQDAASSIRSPQVELDGGTLVLHGEESQSVVLRLTPWRARSVARVLEEWSAVSRVFNRASKPSPDELNLSRTLELAASVLGDDDAPLPRFPRGEYTVPGVSSGWRCGGTG
jgi:hypothetical protein